MRWRFCRFCWACCDLSEEMGECVSGGRRGPGAWTIRED